MKRIGSRVAWTSQAAGRTARKVGEVVEVVQPGRFPVLHGMASTAMERDHVSYVIRARVVGGYNRTRLYWPRVAGLEWLDGDDVPA